MKAGQNKHSQTRQAECTFLTKQINHTTPKTANVSSVLARLSSRFLCLNCDFVGYQCARTANMKRQIKNMQSARQKSS